MLRTLDPTVIISTSRAILNNPASSHCRIRACRRNAALNIIIVVCNDFCITRYAELIVVWPSRTVVGTDFDQIVTTGNGVAACSLVLAVVNA
jgi:hypothetical protein